MTDLLGSIFEVAYTSLVVVNVFIVGLIGYSHNSVSCNKIREAPLEDWKTLLKVCSSVLQAKKNWQKKPERFVLRISEELTRSARHNHRWTVFILYDFWHRLRGRYRQVMTSCSFINNQSFISVPSAAKPGFGTHPVSCTAAHVDVGCREMDDSELTVWLSCEVLPHTSFTVFIDHQVYVTDTDLLPAKKKKKPEPDCDMHQQHMTNLSLSLLLSKTEFKFIYFSLIIQTI